MRTRPSNGSRAIPMVHRIQKASSRCLSRFDGFVQRADGEKGTIMALTIYALAMRILSSTQQSQRWRCGAKVCPHENLPAG